MMLLIRNMESERCKTIVKQELRKLGVHYTYVELGEVEILVKLSSEKQNLLADALKKSGLELMVNQKTLLIDKIKEAVNEYIYSSDDITHPNFSAFITQKVNYDYNYLSKTFSEREGMTIEKYFIQQRIDRVKEMLVYGGFSLNEIAYKMLFSSVAHLSNQFKKVTGLTPFNFRQSKDNYSKKNCDI
jgi:YesN/AraC family two-component response regulator